MNDENQRKWDEMEERFGDVFDEEVDKFDWLPGYTEEEYENLHTFRQSLFDQGVVIA